jgi:hypothetical protein
VLERLEGSQDQPLPPSAPKRASHAPTPEREAVIARIRHARDVLKKTFPQIAEELNAAAIPTFSGRGLWDKGNVRRFYRGM